MLARKSFSKKKILVMGGIMAVVWGIIGIVLYRNYFAGPPSEPAAPVIEITPTTTGETPSAVPLGEGLGLEVLRESRLINLKLFGEVPLEIKALGREDPFTALNP